MWLQAADPPLHHSLTLCEPVLQVTEEEDEEDEEGGSLDCDKQPFVWAFAASSVGTDQNYKINNGLTYNWQVVFAIRHGLVFQLCVCVCVDVHEA